ncbi:MAG: glycosyl hydrolase family 28-related protein [Cyclobacteriaceae bacterium]
MQDTINVKKFGAAGDGAQDDTSAIRQATRALQHQSTLYFPSGTYRIQTPGNAVEVERLSGISVIFEPDAILLMDNLDANQLGTGHAFYFKGPASNLILEGVSIKWKTRSSARSKGDGIRIDGPYSSAGPSEDQTFKNIEIKNCDIENSPQTGMVLMGCSDIHIENIDLLATHADGIHLNACRHYTIDSINGQDLGDDNVALVTYYNASSGNRSLQKNQHGPYTQPSLGEWSNYQGAISNLESASDIGANGIRIAGAFQVIINNVKAQGRKAGIIVDAGKQGGSFGWEYQASRKISIANIMATQCHVGIHIMSYNIRLSDDIFWNFDVSISNVIIKDCIHDNILIEKCGGVSLSNVTSEGQRVRMIQLSKLTVANLQNRGGSVIVHGVGKPKDNGGTPQEDKLALDGILVYGGNLQIENISHAMCGYLHAYDSPNNAGVVLANIRNMQIDSVLSKNAKRMGIQIINCQQLSIASVFIESASSRYTSIEIGGGSATSKSEDISVISGVYKNDGGKPDIILQSGEFAPQNISIHLAYNTLKKNKSWKHYLLNPYQAKYLTN